MNRANFLGVIFAKNGTGSGSYVDVSDQTQATGQLTTSYTEQQPSIPASGVDCSHPWVGARQALGLFVTVGLSVATAVKVKLQGRADSAAPWADLQTAREDTGSVAAEHTFAAGTFVVQTASALTVPQIRIVAAATAAGALDVADQISVTGWVL